MAGERDPLLPRVHDGVGAPGSRHAGRAPRARPRPARTHAPAPHFRHGELSSFFFFPPSPSDRRLTRSLHRRSVITGTTIASSTLHVVLCIYSWGGGSGCLLYSSPPPRRGRCCILSALVISVSCAALEQWETKTGRDLENWIMDKAPPPALLLGLWQLRHLTLIWPRRRYILKLIYLASCDQSPTDAFKSSLTFFFF